MSNIDALNHKVTKLIETIEAPRLGTWSIEQELETLPEADREQARAFLLSIEDRVTFTQSGYPDLSRLSDEELAQLDAWAQRRSAC